MISNPYESPRTTSAASDHPHCATLLYRKTRRSNDSLGWGGAIVMTLLFPIGFSVLLGGAFGVFCLPLPEAVPLIIFCILFGGSFTLGPFYAWWMILSRRTWEIVVADDLVRWGNIRRPDRQRRVTISSIKRIEGEYHDSDLNRTVIELVDGRYVTLPQDILLTRADAEQCVEAIKKARPEIAVQFYG